jgi:hypothetical protein
LTLQRLNATAIIAHSATHCTMAENVVDETVRSTLKLRTFEFLRRSAHCIGIQVGHAQNKATATAEAMRL